MCRKRQCSPSQSKFQGKKQRQLKNKTPEAIAEAGQEIGGRNEDNKDTESEDENLPVIAPGLQQFIYTSR